MIYSTLYDAGTKLVATEKYPGVDDGHYRELDFEADNLSEVWTSQINQQMLAQSDATFRPWPEKFCSFAWVDWSPAYENLTVNCWGENAIVARPSGTYPADWYEKRWQAIPAASLRVRSDTDQLDWRRLQEWQSKRLDKDAVQQRMKDLTTAPLQLPILRWADEQDHATVEWRKYSRERLHNEYGTPVPLADKLTFAWDGSSGVRHTFSLDNNPMFSPFDLRRAYEGWYRFVDDDGNELEIAEAFNRVPWYSNLRLFLRPRRWRFYARVIAHYIYITPFEEVFNDEVFLTVFYDRPPFYPIRYDRRNIVPEIWHPYEGAYLCYDEGIEYKFLHSRAGIDMMQQIVDQQWWSLCTAYLLIGVEPAAVTVWERPPQPGEYVMGWGRVDAFSKVEDRVWAIQVKDVSTIYPQQLIAQYWSDFYIGSDITPTFAT